MILYLSSNENMGLLDYLIEDKKLVVKKLSGEFNLNKFVIHDMRNLSHCTQIVIDLKAIKDTEEELINGITAFRAIYDAKFVIIAEELKQGDELLKKLIDTEVYNLVTAETIENIRKEIEQCIIGDGMTYQDCLKYLPNEIGKQNITRYSFKGTNIKILIAGVIPRVGATTTAMNIANYLANIGATVCYIEANENNHLKTLPILYDELTNKDDYMEYKGVRYCGIDYELDKDYDFIIYDIGELIEKKTSLFSNSNINILCMGGKPYEIKKLYSVVGMIENVELDIVLSFIPPRGRSKIEKLMKELEKNYYFLGYSPDLFDGNVNKEAFNKILENYIEEEIQ